jgi:hypothetical protein
MTTDEPRRAGDPERVRALIQGYRDGEDPDLSRLSHALWGLLYERIPSLTGSTDKNDQHLILEAYLIELGLPQSPDLQYIAGPVLWYAREKRVVPPAQNRGAGASSWTLDSRLFEEGRRTLEEGHVAFGDWMINALKGVLAEQQ